MKNKILIVAILCMVCCLTVTRTSTERRKRARATRSLPKVSSWCYSTTFYIIYVYQTKTIYVYAWRIYKLFHLILVSVNMHSYTVEVGESTHLSQTVDTELEASGPPLRRSVYSGHQHTSSQQSTPSRHDSSDGEGEGEDHTRSRLSESYSPGENNASYSRLVYGNEDEEGDAESESVHSDDVEGSRNSSKPKVFSFAGESVCFILYKQ